MHCQKMEEELALVSKNFDSLCFENNSWDINKLSNIVPNYIVNIISNFVIGNNIEKDYPI